MGAFTIFDTNNGERILPLLTNAGAPTSGTSGTFANVARKGWLLLDETNGALYQNTGTLASPTWTLIEATNVFTTLTLDSGTKTATASAGAATLNKNSGVITTESLTTAATAEYTLTLTNDQIAATDIVLANIVGGTNSAGAPVIRQAVPAAGSVVITVRNVHGTNALNGTLKIAFAVLKA